MTNKQRFYLVDGSILIDGENRQAFSPSSREWNLSRLSWEVIKQSTPISDAEATRLLLTPHLLKEPDVWETPRPKYY